MILLLLLLCRVLQIILCVYIVQLCRNISISFPLSCTPHQPDRTHSITPMHSCKASMIQPEIQSTLCNSLSIIHLPMISHFSRIVVVTLLSIPTGAAWNSRADHVIWTPSMSSVASPDCRILWVAKPCIDDVISGWEINMNRMRMYSICDTLPNRSGSPRE